MLLEHLIPHILDIWRKTGKVGHLQVTGESMFPLIGPKNTLQVVHCLPQKLRLGDIVIIRTEDGLAAHRLVYRQVINRQIFWTEKGDNSSRVNTVPQENIICRVQQIEDERGVRWVNKGWRRFINRLLGAYWRLIIFLFLVKERISALQSEGQNPPATYWLESSKFNLHYIPQLLIKLNCRSEK